MDTATILNLVTSDDPDQIVRGVELLAAVGDHALWNTLLDGVRYRASVRVPGWFEPSGRLDQGRGTAWHHQQFALLLLVAGAEEALRDSVTSLTLQLPATSGLAALRAVARLPNLRLLVMRAEGRTPLEDQTPLDLAPLGACAQLRSLVVRSGVPVSLAGLPALRELRVVGPLVSTAGIEGIRQLEHLVISSDVLRDLHGLDETPVQRVQITCGPAFDEREFARLRHVDSVGLSLTCAVDLGALAGATLTHLWVSCDAMVEVPPMPRLRSLAMHLSKRLEVTVRGWSRAEPPRSPGVASAFPALRQLDLRCADLPDLTFLRGSALQSLKLTDCRIGDTSALGTLPGLEHLDLDQVDTERLDELPPVSRSYGGLHLTSTRLRSIRGLGRLDQLAVLRLAGCTALTSLDGVQGTAIQLLDLRNCTALEDLAPLAELADLKMVALAGTRFGRSEVPPGVLTFFGPDVDLCAHAQAWSEIHHGTQKRLKWIEIALEFWKQSELEDGLGLTLPDRFFAVDRDVRALAKELVDQLRSASEVIASDPVR